MKSVATSQTQTSDTPPTTVQRGALRWTVRAGVRDKTLDAVLENPDSFLTDKSQHFKNSRSVTVARIPLAGKSGWVLRRLNYGKPLHRLRDSLRPTRAHRAFANGLRLEQAGVPTARVLAAGEIRRLRCPVHAYLLTEEIPGAVTLEQLMKTKPAPPQKALSSLAETLAGLHDAGFSHRDLKSSNVLFTGDLQAYLIDLDGVRRIRGPVQRQAVADLARLAKGMMVTREFSSGGWVEFLKTYCLRRGLTDWQHWVVAVAAKRDAES
ncbi:MAG TPA: lipopolysaccharide kinase InaA family protein [Verrucomicrobiota bacterium]|nr:lipopolysaccharide kinase InaA family protein [Verrucomicrobiota bacterium]